MLSTRRYPARAACALILALVLSPSSPLRGQAPAIRVVSLVPAATELIEAMGAGDRLIGVGRDDETPSAAGLPRLGGAADPSVERILSMDPDLVVTWRSITGSGPVRHLRAAGVPVYEATIETFGDVEATAVELGRLLGRRDEADSVGVRVRAVLDSLRSEPRGSPPSVLLVLHPRDPILTTGRGTYIDELVSAAGGRNVFGDVSERWPLVDRETIVTRQPDVLILPGTHAAGGVLARLPWSALDAVREGRVMTVPESRLLHPGPGSIDLARDLATFLDGVVPRDSR